MLCGQHSTSVWRVRQNTTYQGLPAKHIHTALHPWPEAMTFTGLSTPLGRGFPKAFPHWLDPIGRLRPLWEWLIHLLTAGEDQSNWQSAITSQGLAVFLPLVTEKVFSYRIPVILNNFCFVFTKNTKTQILLAHSPLEVLLLENVIIIFFILDTTIKINRRM